jgi:hypothetical protein
MCEWVESLCRHLEVEVAQIRHGLVVLLVGTQLVKLNRLVVVLHCLSETLLETETQVVLGAGTISGLSEEVHCLFIFLRMVEKERT